MVGVPKSCAICQARKVKCDRKVGGCSQCIKYQWDCPGYPANKPKRARSYKGTHNKQGLPSTKQSQAHDSHDLARRNTCAGKFSKPPNHPHRPSYPTFTSLSTSWAGFLGSPLALELIGLLSPVDSTGQSINQLGSFLSLVPSRLGTNEALDDAVKCLCTGYIASISGKPPAGGLHYDKALRSLRRGLDDTGTGLSDETLCASICLSWYEVLVDGLSPLWVVHTAGSARLIQLRGPEKHLDGFGRLLLHTERGLIAAESLMCQKACFLSEPRWANVVESPVAETSSDSSTATFEDHFNYLDALSTIRSEMRGCGNPGELCTTKLAKLEHRLRLLRSNLRVTLFPTCVVPGHQECEDAQSSELKGLASLIRCKDILTHISIDLAMLDLRQALDLRTSSALWAAQFLPDLIPIFEDEILSDFRCNLEQDLNDEIESLFKIAITLYHQALQVCPLNCRRLSSSYRAIYLQLQQRTQWLHPVWHRIDALMRGEI
ncbi:hypothetical protein GGR57DRAFT_118057 [Xylariaceae sp. FL1272]|nr:hypothetical protein GGR57DRAFT_118057 [Xylariaceae sp. FL1272]